MNKIESCKVMSICLGTSTTSATALSTIDTLGCKKAHIYVLSGTQVTTSQVWSDISVYHGTNTAATTLISKASWATAATTSALNALPASALVGNSGSVVEIHLNLSKYDRYINVLTTRGATPTANANGAMMVLLEPKISADSAAAKACASFVPTSYTSGQVVATVNVP